MAELEDFLKLLQEIVSGNKLSSSRVEKVKQAAVKCFYDATPVAKAILRQHTRASSSTKVSSLYLFDAIARHAKDIVKKNGVGFDANDARAPAGSDAIDGTVEALISGASNFLAAASEVASELALDTVKSVSREQQEKVKKVVDIWYKAATFDARLLKDLQRDVAKASSGSSSRSSIVRSTTPPTDPRLAKRRPAYPYADEADVAPTPAPAPAAAAAAAPGLPASVLALLGGNQSTASQPTAAAPPTAPAPSGLPSFDLTQLTALQQLTSGGVASGGPPPPGPPPPAPAPAPASVLRRSQSPPRPVQSRYEERKPPPSQPSAPALARGFDMSTFDPTDAGCWEQLGALWQSMYGYLPANQELMFAVMSGMFPPPHVPENVQ